MSRSCVVSIDLQLDFFDPKLDVGKLEKALCLPGVRRLIRHARVIKQQVFHLVTVHEGSASMPFHLAKRNLPPYCLRDTEGAAPIDELIGPNDRRVTKTNYSGFFDTTLADELKAYDTLILCGIATDCCVLLTAFDAASHGKHVYVPYQTVSASTVDAYVHGLQMIAKSAGAVVDLENILTQQVEQDLWEGRLQGELTIRTRDWYSGEQERLAAFKDQHSELLASPTTSAQQIVARLEEFFADRYSP